MSAVASAQRFDIRAVVAGRLCVGCGACAAATRGRAVMRWTEHELFEADLTGLDAGEIVRATAVCPFSDDAGNEDALAAGLWDGVPLDSDPAVGRYLTVGAGRILDSASVVKSSSGGLTTYVLQQLLQRGLVDGVIHVRDSTPGAPTLVEYAVSRGSDALLEGAKSRYHPIEMSGVIDRIRGDGKRYAFVGVPCFVKAARLLCKADPAIGEQLPYFIGLVCGHLKSGAFARNFAWQMGIEPAALGRFDFRVKDPARPANAYAVAAVRAGSEIRATAPTRDLFGSDWGHMLFRPKACDFCDDIGAELADVCFGDAWLPKYESNWQGTNIYITRHPVFAAILEEGRRNGHIVVFDSDVPEFVASQDANYRQRREGLRVRLADLRRKRLPHPAKRVFGENAKVGWVRRNIYRTRIRLGDQSHVLFKAAREGGDYAIFRSGIETILRRYYWYYRVGNLAKPAYLARRILERLGIRGPVRKPSVAEQ